jgi:hypothetical protein
MSLLKIVLSEPLIFLETLTLLVALGGLIRLSLTGWPVEPRNNRAKAHAGVGTCLNTILSPIIGKTSISRRLLALFEVGTLISLPKQSLQGQRVAQAAW